MVTVSDYQQRTSTEGTPFQVLELTSQELEMVVSQQTGRYYATVRKCYIPATFPEAVCRLMVGKQLPGCIIKTECDPYEFTVPETGEVITRKHRYEYSPVEQSSMEQTVLSGVPLIAIV
ncbi:hypothetical protein [Fibrella forsythiae]|uniref:Uncharacterized protein n=1 Tax=Fibrella forsythiae TaxID=2817061 RepID=A0ABS3JSZ4_9BACT|nr:hypothetical protein [Fibrella forsythiae]MBO0952022.1 hypothetical protein [Fibrella forsythiae]